ncbi:MAG: DUF4981 domain-containing protein [Treponema sp.]|jgi:beta-galactosidase|nr:DUF4981 domain-containing protein [Treponema sp.]
MFNDTVPFWENPEIQGINRLPMRSPLLPFISAKAALADAVAGPEYRDADDNPFYFNLDGTWDFTLLDNPNDDDFRWLDSGLSMSGVITAPGTWTRQGYDKPHYTNVQMPFDETPPHAPKRNPTGLYRRRFTLPPMWKDRRVVLHIGSAESCCLVYLNGGFVGAGKDTRLPHEFDITDFVHANGNNTLCLKVVRYSDASYIEDQDQWWLGGLHRSVFLYTTDTRFIKDIKAVPGEVQEGKCRLRLSVTLGGNLPAGKSAGNAPVEDTGERIFTITYALYPFVPPQSPSDVSAVCASLEPLVKGELSFTPNYRINADCIEADIVADNPALWSHEHPNLYVLTVSLYENSENLENTAFCTAFRSVRICKRELLINGRAVLIKGVNRHEHDEHTGKTLSTAAMLKDIFLLKQHNFNAVRMCHYPNDERWYELCNRYGVYLTGEANIEHHCFYMQLSYDTRWSPSYLSRMQRMVERDKNHPSVIIWSLGNESGDGPNHALTGAWARRYDPSRPVQYEGMIRPEGGQGPFTLDSLARNKDATAVICPMYPEIKLITDFVKYREDERPLIMQEYSHAMGNSNGSLADYWKAIETYRGLQGGFIWEWMDHGFAAIADNGQKYWKYGGDFGDDPTDYDFCCDGLLFPDQTPKPVMAECKQVFSPVKIAPVHGKPYSFTVENKLDFSTLDVFYLDWRLCGDEDTFEQGRVDFPAIAPDGCAEITLPITEAMAREFDGVLYIHMDVRLRNNVPWAEAGFIVSSGEKVLKEKPPCSADLGNNPLIRNLTLHWEPSLFRVPTQNDGLKTYRHLYREPAAAFYWQDKAMYPWLEFDLLNMRCVEEKNEAGLWHGYEALYYSALLSPGAGASTAYRDKKIGMYSRITIPAGKDHPLIIDVSFDVAADLPELPKVGVRTAIPAYYSTIRWFGRGPHEAYGDRCASALLGVYEGTPDTLETPYVVPQENGNRYGVRKIVLSGDAVPENQPASITIIPDTPVNMSVNKYTQQNMWEALHTYDLVDIREKENRYTLNIDIAQRGVGTATCGPDTLEEYRVRPGLYRLRLMIG